VFSIHQRLLQITKSLPFQKPVFIILWVSFQHSFPQVVWTKRKGLQRRSNKNGILGYL
jgi:hypothetical protein